MAVPRTVLTQAYNWMKLPQISSFITYTKVDGKFSYLMKSKGILSLGGHLTSLSSLSLGGYAATDTRVCPSGQLRWSVHVTHN